MLDIALLGTGALSPAPDRALSAAWLACCGHAILFDCGEGTQTAARRAGVSLMKIDLIALTHYHGDHIFGLPGLLQTMQAQERLSPLFITGPEGLSSVLEPILRLTGPLAFEVRPIPPFEGALPLCDLASGWPAQARLSRFPTRHRVLSQGYRFALGRSGKFDAHKARALGVPVECWRLLQQGQDAVLPGRVVHPEAVIGPERPGLRVVFTGDTARCAPLVEAARGADLLICDATYGEAGQEAMAEAYGHMTFVQAATVAREAGAKRLWLTHFSQRMAAPESCLPGAAAVFPAAECGRDGMRLTLTFP